MDKRDAQDGVDAGPGVGPTVTCVKCGAPVPESEVVYSRYGPVCKLCLFGRRS